MIMLRTQSMSESSQGSSGSSGEEERESTRAPTSPPRSKVWAVVRALRFHHCGPGSNPSIKAICEVSFCSLFQEAFLWVLQFSPLLKNQHLQIPIRSGMQADVSTSSHELLSAPWVNK